MRTITAKLRAAGETIARLEWLRYFEVGLTLQIDRRLLPLIGRHLPDGEWGVAAVYRRDIDPLGPPDENPAQVEKYMDCPDNDPPVVYYCIIGGRAYVCAEPMFPF